KIFRDQPATSPRPTLITYEYYPSSSYPPPFETKRKPHCSQTKPDSLILLHSSSSHHHHLPKPTIHPTSHHHLNLPPPPLFPDSLLQRHPYPHYLPTHGLPLPSPSPSHTPITVKRAPPPQLHTLNHHPPTQFLCHISRVSPLQLGVFNCARFWLIPW
ncbi:hypothetical protein RND81_03G062900, partial [Saponaria officinalis]